MRIHRPLGTVPTSRLTFLFIALASTAALADDAAHVLLTVEVAPRTERVLDARLVDSALPAPLVESREPWRVEVHDAQGALLFEQEVTAPNVLRSEHQDSDRKLRGIHLKKATFAVGLRVPVLPQAETISLYAEPGSLADPVEAEKKPKKGKHVRVAQFAYPKEVLP